MATPDGRTVIMLSDTVWQSHGDTIRSIDPSIEPLVYSEDVPFPDDVLDTVDIAFFSADCWPGRSRGFVISILKAQNLRWLQTFSAGVDSPFFVDLMGRGVLLTTASGSSASPIAQTVVLYMLALSRDMRRWMRDQDAHRWEQHQFVELEGAALAVVGMGPIGMEVARLGIALGMEVEAVRRTPSGDEPCTTHGLDRLHDVLGKADWVVSALPLTPDTRQIFGAGAFAAMKPGARFVNVGRGELVDEPAMVAALQSGALGGAGLDVFAVEPLPADSPLWAMDNVIITPHNSATSTSTGARSQAIFLDNLERHVNGRPLRNVANP